MNTLSIIQRVVSRYKQAGTQVMTFKYEPKETKGHKAERVGDYIRETTGLQKGTALAIADAFVRGRDVIRLSIPKEWPIEDGVIKGPKGGLPVSELGSLQGIR